MYPSLVGVEHVTAFRLLKDGLARSSFSSCGCRLDAILSDYPLVGSFPSSENFYRVVEIEEMKIRCLESSIGPDSPLGYRVPLNPISHRFRLELLNFTLVVERSTLFFTYATVIFSYRSVPPSKLLL